MRFVQGGLVSMLVGVALAAPAAFAQAPASTAAKPGAAPAAVQAPARVPLSIARGVVKCVADSRLVIDLGQTSSGAGRALHDGRPDADPAPGAAPDRKDLRVGDAVTVGYQMHGDKAVASRVWLRFGGSTAGASR
jgi:hypothetical protein